MKKIFFLGLILCFFSGCVMSSNNQVEKVDEETLLSNEKRTQAQPKTYSGDEFTLSITSDKKDTRTYLEINQDIPPKYEITNTVLFEHIQLYDGDLLYAPKFGIKKIIKEYTGELSFVLSAQIMTNNSIRFNDVQLVQLKLNTDVTQSFSCGVDYLPAPGTLSSIFHIINCTSDVFIKDIHTMRLQHGDANVSIMTSNNNFSFVLPEIFFTYLNEI